MLNKPSKHKKNTRCMLNKTQQHKNTKKNTKKHKTQKCKKAKNTGTKEYNYNDAIHSRILGNFFELAFFFLGFFSDLGILLPNTSRQTETRDARWKRVAGKPTPHDTIRLRTDWARLELATNLVKIVGVLPQRTHVPRDDCNRQRLSPSSLQADTR